MIAKNDENQKKNRPCVKTRDILRRAFAPSSSSSSTTQRKRGRSDEERASSPRRSTSQASEKAETRKQEGEERLHRLPGEHVLDVRNCPGGIHERATWEDRETLLGGVQHLLDVGQHPRDIRGDQWMLNNKNMVSKNRSQRRIHDVRRCRAQWPCAGATAAKA